MGLLKNDIWGLKKSIFAENDRVGSFWSLGDSEWGLKVTFCYNLVLYVEVYHQKWDFMARDY